MYLVDESECISTNSLGNQYCRYCNVALEYIQLGGKHFIDCKYWHFVTEHRALDYRCVSHKQWEDWYESIRR